VLQDGPEAYTRHTLIAAETLTRALAQIRELGWAAEVEEMTMGEAGIAAPIRGLGGLVVGAIGILGPVERICDPQGHPQPHLITQVRNAARAISRDLGAARW
jgi:DNA-binding IclR family transcriptional regulator